VTLKARRKRGSLEPGGGVWSPLAAARELGRLGFETLAAPFIMGVLAPGGPLASASLAWPACWPPSRCLAYLAGRLGCSHRLKMVYFIIFNSEFKHKTMFYM
jgi:hypothetical protein